MYKKTIIYIFLVFFVSNSFSQTEQLIPKAIRQEKNKRDELNRRQDVWKIYTVSGNLISAIEYKNDKKEGKSIIYYFSAESKVKEEIQYFDGKKDGSYLKKYLSGQTAIEGVYALGLRTGTWTFYYEDAQVRTEGSYVDGKKDGKWKFFNRKGILTRITKCKFGKCKVKYIEVD